MLKITLTLSHGTDLTYLLNFESFFLLLVFIKP
jgi:hypothetical protein